MYFQILQTIHYKRFNIIHSPSLAHILVRMTDRMCVLKRKIIPKEWKLIAKPVGLSPWAHNFCWYAEGSSGVHCFYWNCTAGKITLLQMLLHIETTTATLETHFQSPQWTPFNAAVAGDTARRTKIDNFFSCLQIPCQCFPLADCN